MELGHSNRTSALGDPPCFIGSCKAQGGSLRMASFSKEHDRNVFSCPFYCVKWRPCISRLPGCVQPRLFDWPPSNLRHGTSHHQGLKPDQIGSEREDQIRVAQLHSCADDRFTFKRERLVFQIVMTFFGFAMTAKNRHSKSRSFLSFPFSSPCGNARERVFPASVRHKAHREAVSWDCALR